MTILTAIRPSAGWQTFVPAPGSIYTELQDRHYRAAPGISQSGLAKLSRSPMHLRYYLDNPTDPTEAMIVGSGLDCTIFEPAEFDKLFAVDRTGKTRNSNAWKEWRDSVGARTILREKQWQWIESMRDALYGHPVVGTLLQEGIPQASLFWVDEETGVLCKGRTDFWCNPAHSLVVDLKKTTNVAAHKLQRSTHDYGYARQAAMYLDGLKSCGEPADFFAFVFIEEEPPHAIAVTLLETEWIDHARRQYRQELLVYRHCVEMGEWPGPDPEPFTLHLPGWLRKQYEEGET